MSHIGYAVSASRFIGCAAAGALASPLLRSLSLHQASFRYGAVAGLTSHLALLTLANLMRHCSNLPSLKDRPILRNIVILAIPSAVIAAFIFSPIQLGSLTRLNREDLFLFMLATSSNVNLLINQVGERVCNHFKANNFVKYFQWP